MKLICLALNDLSAKLRRMLPRNSITAGTNFSAGCMSARTNHRAPRETRSRPSDLSVRSRRWQEYKRKVKKNQLLWEPGSTNRETKVRRRRRSPFAINEKDCARRARFIAACELCQSALLSSSMWDKASVLGDRNPKTEYKKKWQRAMMRECSPRECPSLSFWYSY